MGRLSSTRCARGGKLTGEARLPFVRAVKWNSLKRSQGCRKSNSSERGATVIASSSNPKRAFFIQTLCRVRSCYLGPGLRRCARSVHRSGGYGPTLPWFLAVTELGIGVRLIFLISRRGSVVAKWILVIFTAAGLLKMAIGIGDRLGGGMGHRRNRKNDPACGCPFLPVPHRREAVVRSKILALQQWQPACARPRVCTHKAC